MIDAAMSAPFSYFIAVFVMAGLLSIFVVVVRRVASHGANPETGQRGRGPRLGIIDSFSVDKDRQLIIVRRDDVEHLLMIGGTNDIVIETNIVRTLGAQVVRGSSLMATVAEPIEAPVAPQSIPPLAPAAPRLRPTQQSVSPQAPLSVRLQLDDEAIAPTPSMQMHAADILHDDLNDDVRSASSVTQRQAFNQSELIDLAKRLEANIPPTAAPMPEKPVIPLPSVESHPVSLSTPITPQNEVSSFQSPAPVTVGLKPQAPPRASRPLVTPQMRPAIQQPPIAPQPVPLEQQGEAPQFAEQQPMPMPQPIPVPPPVQTQSSNTAPQVPKDRQAAALDENLRRLLGRKVNPN